MGSDGHHMAMSSIVSGLRSAPIAVVNAPVKSVEMDRPCCEHCRTWTEGCTECGWQCPCKINDSGQAWRDDSTRRAKRWPPTEQKKNKMWERETQRERERERELRVGSVESALDRRSKGRGFNTSLGTRKTSVFPSQK